MWLAVGNWLPLNMDDWNGSSVMMTGVFGKKVVWCGKEVERR